jgi:RNA polymerase sigma-70 factor (ECF subfamily)
MLDADTFPELIRRVRAGDEQAAAELVRQNEPLIRRAVRLHLEDQGLCRLFDSMDVCQSVLASFFVRTAAGQYDLQRPEQLVKLLVTMARNKLISAARRQRRQRRDHRRIAAAGADLHQIASREPDPGERAAGKELLDRAQGLLSHEEKQLVELRSQGLGWGEIAGQVGGTAQARRMQLARALDRVTQALGLEDSHD